MKQRKQFEFYKIVQYDCTYDGAEMHCREIERFFKRNKQTGQNVEIKKDSLEFERFES
jgi:hypothetical protein